MEKLNQEFEYYVKHQPELVEKYDGRYVVIVDQKVIGVFDTQDDAINAMLKKGYKIGDFLVHLVGEGKENYSAILYNLIIGRCRAV